MNVDENEASLVKMCWIFYLQSEVFWKYNEKLQ